MLPVLHTQLAADNSVSDKVYRCCTVQAIDRSHIWLARQSEQIQIQTIVSEFTV